MTVEKLLQYIIVGGLLYILLQAVIAFENTREVIL